MQIYHLLFFLGFIVQAVLLVKDIKSFKDFFFLFKIVLFFALFVFLSSIVKSYNNTQSFYVALGNSFSIIFFLFPIVYFFVFLNKIFNKINELIILSFTLIFWYVFLLKSHPNIFSFILLLIPTIGVMIVAFSRFQLNNYQKFVFYLWYLIIDIFLITSYFLSGSLYSFFFIQEIKNVSLLSSFFMGTSFLYLSCNILCFFLLFSGGGRSFRLQSFKETLKEILENARPVIDKYSDEQAKPLHSLMLIIFQGGFLVLNYLYKFIPDILVVSLFITIIPQLLSGKGGDFKESASTVSQNRF